MEKEILARFKLPEDPPNDLPGCLSPGIILPASHWTLLVAKEAGDVGFQLGALGYPSREILRHIQPDKQIYGFFSAFFT